MKNPEAKFNQLNLQETSCSPNHQADHHNASVNHQSAELIGCNDDLLNDILGRLPAKSILRFKAVSKQWLSLLTHPRFTLLYDKLLKSSGLYYNELPVSFNVENPIPPPFRMLDFHPHIRSLDVEDYLFPNACGITILESCNGLLMCCFEAYRRYFVFNPTTRKLALIPPVIADFDVRISLMGLAYHPTECVHYKLVCLVDAINFQRYNENGHRIYDIQIYSSRTKTWKKLNQTVAPFRDTEFGYGVYWNGAFHWAPCYPNPKYLRMDTEDIQDLPLPETVTLKISRGSSYMPLHFGESRGHLHLVDTPNKNNYLILNVYEMLRDHSGWFIKYQVDLSELCATYPNRDKYDFGILDVVVRGEEEKDTFMVVKALDNIKRYHILDQSFKQLFSIPDNEGMRYVNAHRYIEKIGSF